MWDLPDVHGVVRRAEGAGLVVNDWQLSGMLRRDRARATTIGYTYQNGGGNVNLTGSPNYAARILIIGDPGSGCSSDQYKQFTRRAFPGPLSGSMGLESGRNYMVGCPDHTLDLAIARNIRARRRPAASSSASMCSTRSTPSSTTAVRRQLQLNSPTDPTVRNPQFNADGTLNPTPPAAAERRLRRRDRRAGDAQRCRLQLRFQF